MKVIPVHTDNEYLHTDNEYPLTMNTGHTNKTFDVVIISLQLSRRLVLDSGFRIQDSVFWIQDSGFWIQDSGFSVLDSRPPNFEFFGFRIQDS